MLKGNKIENNQNQTNNFLTMQSKQTYNNSSFSY